jgi:hypothetical protein
VAGRAVLLFAATSLILAALPLILSALATIAPAPPNEPVPPSDVTLAQCRETWSQFGLAALLGCAAFPLIDLQAWWWTLLIAGSLIVGLYLWRRNHASSAAIFLVALGAWGLPRAIGVLVLPQLDAPQPATLDVAVTIVVAVLAVAWYSGRQRSVGPGALALVLVVSTLFVHIGSASPTIGLLVVLAFAAVFPVVYELALNSEQLNEESTDRPARVITWLGLRALGLTLLAALVVVNVESLRGSGTADIGLVFFGIPLTVTLVAAVVSRMPHTASDSGEVGPRRTLLKPLGGGVAAGIAVVGVLALIGWLLQPVIGGLYPTPAERLAAVGARQVQVDAEVQTILKGDAEPMPAAITGVWTREVDWLAQNPPPGCAIDVWRAWRDVLDDYYLWGVLVDGAIHPSPTRTQAEVDLVSKSITDWPTKVQARVAALDAANTKALGECPTR